MTDDIQAQPEDGQQAANQNVPGQLDPQFFSVVNEFLELTNRQSQQQGLKRISMASLYATARFNAHVYLSNAGSEAGKDRPAFLDYMTKLYRQMLNEHLDGLGHERGMDVGESELKAEIAALQAAREAQGKPAA